MSTTAHSSATVSPVGNELNDGSSRPVVLRRRARRRARPTAATTTTVTATAANGTAPEAAAQPAAASTPAGIINRAQRPAPDVPLWQRVHPLTCGLCDVPERDTDPLIAFDLPGGAVELRCRRHPSYRQVLSVADPIHPSNLRRPQAG